MIRIKIGNSLLVRWQVDLSSEPSWTGLSTDSTRLFLCHPAQVKEIEDYELADNVLTFTFPGDEQTYTGIYSLLLCDSGDSMLSLTYERAFSLVRFSSEETELPDTNDDDDYIISLVSDVVAIRSFTGDVDLYARVLALETSIGEFIDNNTADVLKIEQSLGGFIYADETETITLSVWSWDGGEEKTDEYTFSVSRDSGDEASDAVWDAEAGHLDCGTEFDLDIDDMNLTGRTSLTTKFWVTATYTDGTTEEAVVEY